MPRVVLAVAGVVCAAVLYELPPEDYAIYPRCLMFSLTGWQCPGCGGLRAAHALLHGRVAAAWALNPMAVVLGVLGGVYAACHVLRRVTGRDWVGFWRRPIWPWVWLGVLVLFTLLRNWPAAAAWLAP
ncbi:MAG: DUF2752 domain-containing protein [Verrucomicrobia bacterium]|nr:DUF2752 domain-containing protein [Verrucomicrobiota bacterium]